MKIGFYAPAMEFTDAIFDGLKEKLAHDHLVGWRPGSLPPAKDIEILLAVGLVDRGLMKSLPKLAFLQTLSDGYEGVDVEAATELGIRVSYAPGDLTGNADSVAEYTVLLIPGRSYGSECTGNGGICGGGLVESQEWPTYPFTAESSREPTRDPPRRTALDSNLSN